MEQQNKNNECGGPKAECAARHSESEKKRVYISGPIRGYDMEDGEIESIIEAAEEDGDSVLDCADGALKELVEDWVADHQE